MTGDEVVGTPGGMRFELPSWMSDRLSKPTTKKGQLQRAVLAVVFEHDENGELPTSNRFVYYELGQRGVVSKVRTGARRSDQDTIDASKRLRDEGIVPWDWLVDETRSVFVPRYAATVAEYLAETVDLARIDLWAGKPPPLILCESRTFGGVLKRTVSPEYLVPVAPTNGQVGGFLHTDVAPLLNGNERVVLYVGDLDWQGGQIEANTRRV